MALRSCCSVVSFSPHTLENSGDLDYSAEFSAKFQHAERYLVRVTPGNLQSEPRQFECTAKTSKPDWLEDQDIAMYVPLPCHCPILILTTSPDLCSREHSPSKLIWQNRAVGRPLCQ